MKAGEYKMHKVKNQLSLRYQDIGPTRLTAGQNQKEPLVKIRLANFCLLQSPSCLNPPLLNGTT